MILVFVWALSGVILGFEAAQHGIVQIMVPAFYLLLVVLWLLSGLVIAALNARRKHVATPTPEAIRAAFDKVAAQRRERQRPEGV